MSDFVLAPYKFTQVVSEQLYFEKLDRKSLASESVAKETP